MTPALFQTEFVRNGSLELQLGRISCLISKLSALERCHSY